MEYTNEQLEQAIAGLPEEFQEAIASSHISTKVREIGNRYKLSAVQSGKLADNAMLAALGLINSANFSETLSKDMAVPITQAQLIVTDVNKIFNEIRKSVQEKTVEPEKDEEAEPLQPTTYNLQPQEEPLKRADVLHGIENPEPMGGSKGAGTSLLGNSLPNEKKESPPEKTTTPTPTAQIGLPVALHDSTTQAGNIAEQKLTQPFKIESKETVIQNKPTINDLRPTIKVDPYREAV